MMQHFIKFCFMTLVLSPSLVWANIVSVDVQNFSSITSGIDFVTVHSSETIRPCYLNCGLFLNYGSNTLPNLQEVGKKDFKDKLFFSDINFGLGLTKNWDMGVSFAQVHSQSLGNDFAGVKYKETGFTDIRVNTKYRFFGDERGGVATVLSASFNQIDENPFVGSGAGPTFNLEFVGDTTLGNNVAVAANIGYRFRSPGKRLENSFVQPIGNQWIASVAASYLLPDFDTKIVAEIFSGFLEVDRNKDSLLARLDVMEALLGVKYDISHFVAGHLGLGFGLLPKTASADWRLYGGFNINFGPNGLCKEVTSKIVRVEEGESPVDAMLSKDGRDTFDAPPQSELERFLANVLFGFDQDTLSDEGKANLKRLADYLNRDSEKFVSILVEGHTDSIGNEFYNIDLSQRRAKTVQDELIAMGISQEKTRIKGLGHRNAIADNGNYQGRALNRRVEFNVEWRGLEKAEPKSE